MQAGIKRVIALTGGGAGDRDDRQAGEEALKVGVVAGITSVDNGLEPRGGEGADGDRIAERIIEGGDGGAVESDAIGGVGPDAGKPAAFGSGGLCEVGIGLTVARGVIHEAVAIIVGVEAHGDAGDRDFVGIADAVLIFIEPNEVADLLGGDAAAVFEIAEAVGFSEESELALHGLALIDAVAAGIGAALVEAGAIVGVEELDAAGAQGEGVLGHGGYFIGQERIEGDGPLCRLRVDVRVAGAPEEFRGGDSIVRIVLTGK